MNCEVMSDANHKYNPISLSLGNIEWESDAFSIQEHYILQGGGDGIKLKIFLGSLTQRVIGCQLFILHPIRTSEIDIVALKC